MRGKSALTDLAEVLYPEDAQEPILARAVRGALMEWLTEIWAEKELQEVGLTPRRRALFYGPPGTGKTTLAHHLAARLGLPLVIARADQMIDKYVGSTSQNIAALFDAVRAADTPSVMFLDEFDSLGMKRMAATQGAETERNHSVNTILQRIDSHTGTLLAATTRADDLDEAVWRRFEIQIEIALPGPIARKHILARYLKPYALTDAALRLLADSFNGAAPALMRQWCEGLKRQIVGGPRAGWDMDKERVFERLVSSIAPHPDLPRPRLWSMGLRDPGITELTWPLERAA